MLSVLRELQEATESSGLDTLTRVALEVDQVLAPFQLPRTPCQDFPEWAGVDDTARGLYPTDAPLGLLPLNCKGEGNVLFDAVSMLLVGNTELSLELQVSSDDLLTVSVVCFTSIQNYSSYLCVHLMITILIAVILFPTGTDSSGNGVVEEILPVWNDRFKSDASSGSLQSLCRRVSGHAQPACNSLGGHL